MVLKCTVNLDYSYEAYCRYHLVILKYFNLLNISPVSFSLCALVLRLLKNKYNTPVYVKCKWYIFPRIKNIYLQIKLLRAVLNIITFIPERNSTQCLSLSYNKIHRIFPIITKRTKMLLTLRERGVRLYKFYDHEEPVLMVVIFLHLVLDKEIFARLVYDVRHKGLEKCHTFMSSYYPTRSRYMTRLCSEWSGIRFSAGASDYSPSKQPKPALGFNQPLF